MSITDDSPESGPQHQSQAIWIDERSGQIVEMASNRGHAWARAFSRGKEFPVRAQSTQARTPGQQLRFDFITRVHRVGPDRIGRRPLPARELRRLLPRGGAP